MVLTSQRAGAARATSPQGFEYASASGGLQAAVSQGVSAVSSRTDMNSAD